MRRRTFLALGGVVALAGCRSAPANSGGGSNRTSARSFTVTPTRPQQSAETSTTAETPAEQRAAGSTTPARARTSTTPIPEKPGRVDNHRVTAVEVVSHDAVRRTAAHGHEWVVTVTLRFKPQDPETVTVYPIGVFFIFFHGDERVYRVHEQVPANTGESPRTATLSAAFDPAAAADTFDRYRIDLVHA